MACKSQTIPTIPTSSHVIPVEAIGVQLDWYSVYSFSVMVMGGWVVVMVVYTVVIVNVVVAVTVVLVVVIMLVGDAKW